MAKTERRGRRMARPNVGTVIMLVAVLLGVAVLAPSLQQFVSQRQRIAELNAHIATVDAEIAELQAEQSRWNDPAYIQAQARGRLLFVVPGETSYLVTDSGAAVAPQEPAEARPDLHETETDWTETLAQSFVTSGLANAPGPDVTGTDNEPASTSPPGATP